MMYQILNLMKWWERKVQSIILAHLYLKKRERQDKVSLEEMRLEYHHWIKHI